MQRLSLRIVLFLLALLVGGAIINVAVAWLSVATMPARVRAELPLFETEIDWVLSRRANVVVKKSIVDRGHFGLRVHAIQYDAPELDNLAFQICAGWPCHSLYEEVWFEYLRDDVLVGDVIVYEGIKAPWRGKSEGVRYSLPALPIWPGFAINTIFYAAMLWVLFALPKAMGRRVRRRRGQCASCGYSLRDNISEKCPECGATV